jgi:DNA-directed RNA polymerase specialized sigma24 family protein
LEINEEILQKITKIAKTLAPKYTFDCHDKEDIEQEAILMGIEALPRYDSSRPLENFLYTHISNRLKNFKRDNYFRPNPNGDPERVQQNKKNILDAGSLTDGIVYFENNLDDILDTKEAIEKVGRELPVAYRKDYLKLCAGTRIQAGRKEEIFSLIKEILDG